MNQYLVTADRNPYTSQPKLVSGRVYARTVAEATKDFFEEFQNRYDVSGFTDSDCIIKVELLRAVSVVEWVMS